MRAKNFKKNNKKESARSFYGQGVRTAGLLCKISLYYNNLIAPAMKKELGKVILMSTSLQVTFAAQCGGIWEMLRMVFIQKLHKQETVGLTAVRCSSTANSLNAVGQDAEAIWRKSVWVFFSIFETVSTEKRLGLQSVKSVEDPSLLKTMLEQGNRKHPLNPHSTPLSEFSSELLQT